jgi:hypothetical protein
VNKKLSRQDIVELVTDYTENALPAEEMAAAAAAQPEPGEPAAPEEQQPEASQQAEEPQPEATQADEATEPAAVATAVPPDAAGELPAPEAETEEESR